MRTKAPISIGLGPGMGSGLEMVTSMAAIMKFWRDPSRSSEVYTKTDSFLENLSITSHSKR